MKNNRRPANQSLGTKIMHSAGWNVVLVGFSSALQLLMMVVLGRLFTDPQLALMGHHYLIFNLFVLVGELGVSASIIQMPKLEIPLLRALFVVNISAGLLFSVLIAAAAPFYASFYKMPELVPMILLTAAAQPLQSLGVVQRALLQKSLDFKRIAFVEGTGSFVHVGLTCLLAWRGFGAFSLPIALAARFAWESALLWSHPGFSLGAIPRTEWKRLRPHLRFGAFMTGDRIFNYLSSNSPSLIIPRVLGSEAFGIYTFGMMIIGQPLLKITQVLTRVLFPGLSQIQSEEERFARAFVTCEKWILLVTLPAMGLFYVLADETVHLLFSATRESAIPVIKALCLYGVVWSVATTNGSALYAKGRSGIALAGSLIILILLPALIFATAPYGIVAVAWMRSLMIFVAYFLWVLVLQRISAIRLSNLIQAYTGALIAGAGGISATWLLKMLLKSMGAGNLMVLMVCAGVGAAVYALILLRLDRSLLQEIRGRLKN